MPSRRLPQRRCGDGWRAADTLNAWLETALERKAPTTKVRAHACLARAPLYVRGSRRACARHVATPPHAAQTGAGDDPANGIVQQKETLLQNLIEEYNEQLTQAPPPGTRCTWICSRARPWAAWTRRMKSERVANRVSPASVRARASQGKVEVGGLMKRNKN